MTGMLITNVIPLMAMSGLRPSQSANAPANNVEKTLPSSTAATIIDNWPGLRAGRRLEVWQRATDDADINAVEQSAKTGDDQ